MAVDGGAPVLVLDLTPLADVRRALWRVAFFAGLTIYLESLLTLVLVTERQVEPWVTAPVAGLTLAQTWLVAFPSRQLVDARLCQRYALHGWLVITFIGVLLAAARSSEPRLVTGLMAVLLTAAPSWPVTTGIRSALRLSAPMSTLASAGAFLTCVSFHPRHALAARLRALGGSRTRWIAPFAVGAVTLITALAILTFLLRLAGVREPGAGIAQVSAVAGAWAFYRTLRHVKLDAAALRAHDARAPVLLLRRFDDDALGTTRLDVATFEHGIAIDLGRLGPTIAVGRPGERLPPLGASRTYLDPAVDWRTTVRAVMEQAALVVVMLGGSDSVVWEFTTAVDTRGPGGVLLFVPPVGRAERDRRWSAFVTAMAGQGRMTLPRALPDGRVLAVWFAGDSPILLVASGTPPRRAVLARGWPEYRLVIRLRECLRLEDLRSGATLTAFLARQLPMLALSVR